MKFSLNSRLVRVLLIVAFGLLLPGPQTAQAFTVMHTFSGLDNPRAGLILAGDTLYGTTPAGGTFGKGTVFKINTDGTGFAVLHNCAGGTGADRPYAGLILSGETLYGTTYYGGDFSSGTVFKINTDGNEFTILYSFTGGSDGWVPFGRLALSGSTLYGTASGGGTSGSGAVFRINTDGTGFANIHSFGGSPSDGANPEDGLTLSGSVLYGTTQRGGSSGWGTVFKINVNGTGFAILRNFNGGAGGGNPNELLLSGSVLYGTAYAGGTGSEGSVFKINTDGTGFSTVYSFTATVDSGFPKFIKTNVDGAKPLGGLTLSGNILYGTTYSGGGGGEGTVFQVNTDGSGFTNRFHFLLKPDPVLAGFFGYLDGAKPRGRLVLLADTLYGTASEGGGLGGTVFRMTIPTAPVIAVGQPTGTDLIDGASSIDFGPVSTGANNSRSFTITNIGAGSLTGLNITIDGTDGPAFTVTVNPTPPLSGPGGSTTFTVRFAPSTEGSMTADLHIASNAADANPFDIRLDGIGTPSPGTFILSAPLYTVNEGTAVTVNIQRINGSFGTAKIRIATTNGTAIGSALGDFIPISPSQEVSFADGDTSEDVIISTTNNTSPIEPNESFTVTLGSPSPGATLGVPASALVCILDSTEDDAIPKATITTPLANASMPEAAGPSITTAGTATDNKGVADVQVSLNGSAFTSANIPSAVLNGPSVTYSGTIAPVPGPNTIQVKSIDNSLNDSTIVSRTFTYVVMRSLLVAVGPLGGGSVTAGFIGSTSRQIGKSYTVTATPAAGQVFDGWVVSGGVAMSQIGVTAVSLEKPKLNFVFGEGLELTARFIPNPFTAVAGIYNGLVRSSPTAPAGGTIPSTSTEGFLNAKVETSGAFSVNLTMDGLLLRTSGVFDNTGNARFGIDRATTVAVARPGKPDVVLDLFLNLTSPAGTEKISGTITQNHPIVITAVSDVEADRAAFDGTTSIVPPDYLGPLNAKATYTAIIKPQPLANQPPILTEANYPQGNGFATITVTKAGAVTFIGTLADNNNTTPITISSTLSKNLECALFAQLYKKLGFLGGLLELDHTNAESDMKVPDILWSRPDLDVQHYPNGWDEVIRLKLEGAKYVVTTGQSAVRTPDGTMLPDDADSRGDLLPIPDADGNVDLEFSGPFMTAVSKHVSISIADVVTKIPAADASFTLAITRSTGHISGKFTRTDDGTKPVYQGIIYQKGSAPGGYGYFLTSTPMVKTFDGQCGAVRLSPQP